VETLLGLIRDFVAAGLGVAILFGVNFSDDQIAGILLLVTTALALISWLYNQHRAGTLR
jgi:hypothetical protein